LLAHSNPEFGSDPSAPQQPPEYKRLPQASRMVGAVVCGDANQPGEPMSLVGGAADIGAFCVGVAREKIPGTLEAEDPESQACRWQQQHQNRNGVALTRRKSYPQVKVTTHAVFERLSWVRLRDIRVDGNPTK